MIKDADVRIIMIIIILLQHKTIMMKRSNVLTTSVSFVFKLEINLRRDECVKAKKIVTSGKY